MSEQDETFEDEPEPSGLVHIVMGLQPFSDEPRCPKCSFTGIAVSYHPNLILNVGQGQYPCGSWYRSNILTGDVMQHLCLRCTRCRYGWPTKTADAWRPPEPELDGEPE